MNLAAFSALGSLLTLRAKAAFDSLNVRFQDVEMRFVHVRQREPSSLRIGHFGLRADLPALLGLIIGQADRLGSASTAAMRRLRPLQSRSAKGLAVERTAQTGPWPDVQVLHRSFPEAAVRHIAQHFCWSEGSTADNADLAFTVTNDRFGQYAIEA